MNASSIYYLSFHILPPRRAQWSQEICVSPIVQNDLREEVYTPNEPEQSPLSIRMAWIGERLDGKAGKPTFESIGAVADTIEWSDGKQAYKPVHVALPSSKPNGHKGLRGIRLALFVDKNGQSTPPWTYDLDREHGDLSQTGPVFIPCLSSLILLGKTEAQDDEQQWLARLFHIGLREPIIVQECAGFTLEGHLWDAALHLTHWLIRTSKKSSNGRMVELGAGVGLVSIAFASLNRMEVEATDLSSAVELLSWNIQRNRITSCRASVVDWESIDDHVRPVDLVMVADCTYNPAFFSPLCSAIRTYLHDKHSKRRECYLAKKHRHTDEDSLWTTMRQFDLDWNRVAGSDGVCSSTMNEFAYTGWGIYRIVHTPPSRSER